MFKGKICPDYSDHKHNFKCIIFYCFASVDSCCRDQKVFNKPLVILTTICHYDERSEEVIHVFIGLVMSCFIAMDCFATARNDSRMDCFVALAMTIAHNDITRHHEE